MFAKATAGEGAALTPAIKLLEAQRGWVSRLGSQRSQRVTAHSLRMGAKGWGSPGAGGGNCVPQRDPPST